VKLLRKLFGLDRPAAPVKLGRDRDLDLKGLERVLKYQFKDSALARTAMTHRSYLHASPGRSGESNERMEFLGDSVVGLAVNEFLYNKFPKLREGELTKMKSLLVSRVILSRAATAMGLGNFVLLSEAEKESGGRNRASILADTLEGIIGAVYLDGGLEPARKLTERLLLREVHEILSDANLANYKSMLQEYVQGEFKTHPQYRISSENGPDHQKLFAVEVVVNGRTLGRGHGSNKKEAEQEAARDALLHFEKMVRSEREGGGERRRRRRGGRGRRSRGGGGRPDDASAGGHPRGHHEGREGREGRGGRDGRDHFDRNGGRRGRDQERQREGREGHEGGQPPEAREHPEGRDRPESTGGEGGSASSGSGGSPPDQGSPPWAASRLHTEP
jgi:ribonuclease III